MKCKYEKKCKYNTEKCIGGRYCGFAEDFMTRKELRSYQLKFLGFVPSGKNIPKKYKEAEDEGGDGEEI